jgi:hypothetical protein
MSAKDNPVIRYSPAPPVLGGNLEPGAYIVVEGLGNELIAGVVVPGEPSPLFDRLGPDWREALDWAARKGAAGESGDIQINPEEWLPW